MIEAPLYSYALKLLRNRAEAEDVAQESLLRLFRAMNNGRLKQSPRAYVFSIAHNLAMDAHRAQARLAVLSSPAGASAGQALTPSDAVENSLLREQLDQALAELNTDQRSALLLREFGELSYGEIAETLRVSVGQVKIWIYRGRRRLAELLDRDGQYIGTRRNEA